MSKTPMDPNDSIVITGIGVVLPGTNDVDQLWQHIANGESQVRRLTRFDADALGLDIHAAAQLDGFDHKQYLPDLPDRFAVKYSRDILVAMSAISEAVRDAELSDAQVRGPRTAIIQSCSRGPLGWWASAVTGDVNEHFGDNGVMFRGLPGCPASLSAIQLGVQGLVTTLSSACVGGHHAIGLAMQQLMSGGVDRVLAGGYEFPILPEVVRCYQAMGHGVLSAEADDPAAAVKPYTLDRDGFALGEGAMTLTLERESTARQRGARIYARLLGHAPCNEAGHATTMDMTGEIIGGLMRRLLTDVDRHRDQVGYFCGHGTATPANDIAESRALRALYRERTDDEIPPHGSNKPIYGHTFGMAGVINVAATALMLRNQQLAKTANQGKPDPECDTDHVADGPRPVDLDVALSMSFAFGSQTSMMALERVEA